MTSNRVQTQDSHSRAKDLLRLIREELADANPACEEARRVLAEVTARHEKLCARVSKLREDEAYWAAEVGEAPATDETGLSGAADMFPREDLAPATGSENIKHADAVLPVLQSAGVPLKVDELVKRLGATGHPLPASDKAAINAIYSAMLRRPHVFRRIGGGYWGLVGRDDHHSIESAQRAIARPFRMNGSHGLSNA